MLKISTENGAEKHGNLDDLIQKGCRVLFDSDGKFVGFFARELDNYPEGEVEEMVELYVAKGMKEGDARATMGLMSKYKELFVDFGS